MSVYFPHRCQVSGQIKTSDKGMEKVGRQMSEEGRGNETFKPGFPSTKNRLVNFAQTLGLKSVSDFNIKKIS